MAHYATVRSLYNVSFGSHNRNGAVNDNYGRHLRFSRARTQCISWCVSNCQRDVNGRAHKSTYYTHAFIRRKLYSFLFAVYHLSTSSSRQSSRMKNGKRFAEGQKHRALISRSQISRSSRPDIRSRNNMKNWIVYIELWTTAYNWHIVLLAPNQLLIRLQKYRH